MPIGAIISQPEANGLKAAYRPVVILVSATATDNTAKPPVVHCDIYFNDVYYKTISKTQYKTLTISNTEWQFDIQDAAQEYLKKFLGNNGEAAIVEAVPVITRTFCRFRSTGYDANGFITSENTAPVQGSSEEDPVSGTGFESNTFFILNATLQHEDSQDLSTHLNSLKRGTWATTTYPITHRPASCNICLDDSDVYPILHEGNDLSCLVLKYKNKGQSSWNTAVSCAVVACPIPATLDIFVLDNGDDTQTFTFDWSTVLAPTAQLDIQYRIANTSGDWTSNVGSIIPTREITLPLGLYDFRVQGVGDCASTPGSVYEDYGIAVCIPVSSLTDPPNLPDGQVGVPYSYTLLFDGTAPIALANIVKPFWMSVDVLGMTVKLTGTPDVDGVDIAVSFDVTNCSGTESVSISDTIDVIEEIQSTFTNNSAATFSYQVRINGILRATGTIAPTITQNFVAPELALGAGLSLEIYTGSHLMITCIAESNSVNIPMDIISVGPGTNNLAQNHSTFAIVNGIHITVT